MLSWTLSQRVEGTPGFSPVAFYQFNQHVYFYCFYRGLFIQIDTAQQLILVFQPCVRGSCGM